MNTNKRNFYLYLIGRFISLIGTGIQQVALPLFILDLTHSGILMGISSALNLVPNIITSPFAGILGDKKDRRNLMVITDFGRGIIICLLGALAFGGNLNIYILFVAQVMISIMDSIFGSSSMAIIGELLQEEELMKAMSVRGGLDAFSQIIGPSLGGIIYGLAGIKAVFFLNGASFIISGIMSMLMVYVSKNHTSEKITTKDLYKGNAKVLSFIVSKKGLLQLCIFCLFINLLIAPLVDIVLPYIVKHGIGFTSQQYGYMLSTFTIGVLVGNLVMGVLSKKVKTKFMVNFGLIGEAVMLITLSIMVFPYLVKTLGGASWILFAVLAIILLSMGAFNALINTPIQTNLQKMVPNDMRSRFFSLLGIFTGGAIPLGSIVYGILLDRFSYQYIVLTTVLLEALFTIIFIANAVKDVYYPKSEISA